MTETTAQHVSTRKYDEELKFLSKVSPTCWKIDKGFVPNMNVCFYILVFNSR